jgi:hypothetical protein
MSIKDELIKIREEKRIEMLELTNVCFENYSQKFLNILSEMENLEKNRDNYTLEEYLKQFQGMIRELEMIHNKSTEQINNTGAWIRKLQELNSDCEKIDDLINYYNLIYKKG